MGFEGTRRSGQPDIDVAIIGAGLSGIGMAAHMQMICPDRSYALFERRPQLGGTWDLFRYPGVRSDSDMHTLGFIFEPWKHEKSIADGPSILEYLNRIVDERGIRQHIRFETKVVSANWESANAWWVITTEAEDGQRSRTTARFLYLGSGYYDYDTPYDPAIPGREDFAGKIIHPQFWPEDYDYSGKRVVVIGSGATAVTIVPAMAKQAAHVTMLQRTPTWYAIRPARDAIANTLRKFLPEKLAYKITRFKNVTMQSIVFKRARNEPQKVKDFLTKKLQEALGPKYDPATFTPPYNPWEQRLCLVPDGDLFHAMNAGKADIVTDHIERIDAKGIQLKSGKRLDCDVIVTATGLALAMAGKIALGMDGQPVRMNERWYYKGCMYSNLPNLAQVFGYLNASWTLRADIDADYVCRLLNHMKKVGADIATPVLTDESTLTPDTPLDLSSGYIQRGLSIQPKNAKDMPWRLNQDYVWDRKYMKESPLDDGIMHFGKATGAVAATAGEVVEPAE
ncbi:cyclohexanone monooxygenase [Novosphingobium sediminis]|uniref:Cyclohexanone monooxygenase n=1 Tax=Novosphingobium sediminis TaxID=707214 RepID=A0A512AIV9_9SPHN|nr:NAD(P)/FAD-dependent oxidoreductase [Novosphingobium sediminis]GEN99621.1 cyclohexanone monooxygenase [Novosphingobium sediminis]